VGSADETDSEQGIAHLLEHMAFRSTEHFAKNNEIGAMMREMGIDFGADMNAQTGFDHTAYDLVVPVHEDNWLADDLSRIEKAVQVLADWVSWVPYLDDIALGRPDSIPPRFGRSREICCHRRAADSGLDQFWDSV
jgi:secreted Zn-dependent insulinase-like peptidase